MADELFTFAEPGTLVVGLAANLDNAWRNSATARSGVTILDVTGPPENMAAFADMRVSKTITSKVLSDGTVRFAVTTAQGANYLETQIRSVITSKEMEGMQISKSISSTSGVVLADAARESGVGVDKIGTHGMVGVKIAPGMRAHVSVVRDKSGQAARISIDLVR